MLDQGNFIALQQVQQRSNLKQLFECPSQKVEKEKEELLQPVDSMRQKSATKETK